MKTKRLNHIYLRKGEGEKRNLCSPASSVGFCCLFFTDSPVQNWLLLLKHETWMEHCCVIREGLLGSQGTGRWWDGSAGNDPFINTSPDAPSEGNHKLALHLHGLFCFLQLGMPAAVWNKCKFIIVLAGIWYLLLFTACWGCGYNFFVIICVPFERKELNFDLR